MKEAKYRAWNTAVKAMLHFENPIGIADGEDRYGMFIPVVEGKMYIGGNHELMDYTGLRDKNCRKVFIDDIVLVDGEDKAIIKQGLGYIGLIYFADIEDPCINKPITPSSYNWEQMQERIEIIGNIYENPELLEVK